MAATATLITGCFLLDGDILAAPLHVGRLTGGAAGFFGVGGQAGMVRVPSAELEVDLFKQLAVAGTIAQHGVPCLTLALHYLTPSIPTRMWTLSTKPKITTKVTKPI